MTQRQHILFVRAGMAGLASVILMPIVRAFLIYAGVEETLASSIIEPFFAISGFVAFFCLGWFGLAPRIGTRMFLWGAFDNAQARYMYQTNFLRFVFLLTDDKRVHQKLATKGYGGGAT